MDALFRLPAAVSHEDAIDQWLDARPSALGPIARRWFSRLRECGPEVRELMHDGCPTACVGDVAFAYVGVYKAHVNLGFFMGAQLRDPCGLLEGSGKRMRHVKLRPGKSMDEAALKALVQAAWTLAVSARACGGQH